MGKKGVGEKVKRIERERERERVRERREKKREIRGKKIE